MWLIGVDTSERKHPGKPVQYFGKEASTSTINMAEGKKVRLEKEVEMDGARRPVVVFFDGMDNFVIYKKN